MSNYWKKLVVKPGSKIRLKHFDPDYHGKYESHKSALTEIQENRQKMEELQYLIYAENKHSLLVVLQGLDAAGKDGVVRHVLTGMNPSGCVSVNFKQPTKEELAHDFLWRVHPHVPAKGSVAIFNRSQYEDVLVARVHGLVPQKVWSKRYDQINDFERLITTENNTTVLTQRYSNFSCTFPRTNSSRGSRNDWMTRLVNGKSATRTIRNVNIGVITSTPSRTCLLKRAPSRHLGLSFPRIINGFGIWLSHRSLSDRWKTWRCSCPNQL